MSSSDDRGAEARVRDLIASAARLALREPEAARRLFAQAAAIGAEAGCGGVADALEAVGRLAAGQGDLATARDALAAAVEQAIAEGAALTAARSRATLDALERPRPHASSADALAAEIRFAGDVLDAAQLGRGPVPALHAQRARLEIRRRLATGGALPAIGRLEGALALAPSELLVLAMCAALTLDPSAAAGLPPAALGEADPSWAAVLDAWRAPAVDDDEPDIELVLAGLVRRGLLEIDADGRPALAPDVEALLAGRGQPVLPAGYALVPSPPVPRDRLDAVPPGPEAPPRLLVITGAGGAAHAHAAHLALGRGWPLWTVRPESPDPGELVRGARALAREALVFDRLLALDLDDIDAAAARLVIAAASQVLARVVALAPAEEALAELLEVGELVPADEVVVIAAAAEAA